MGSTCGGGKRDRTADLLHAMQALSQLSYSPTRGADYTAPRKGLQTPSRAALKGDSSTACGRCPRLFFAIASQREPVFLSR